MASTQRIKKGDYDQDYREHRFGKLKPITFLKKDAEGLTWWRFLCDCGKEHDAPVSRVVRGDTRSCGCLVLKHGHLKGNDSTGTYRSWKAMLRRCNPDASDHPYYQERGIKVCERWQRSFAAFLEDMGEKPTPRHQVDRFPDAAGNYEPGNVRWATPKENSRNRCSSHYLEFNGERLTIVEWAERTGLLHTTISKRLQHGWSIEKALTTMPKEDGRRKRKVEPAA